MKKRHLWTALTILLAQANGKVVSVRFKGRSCSMQVADIRITEKHILVYPAGGLPTNIKRVREIIVEHKGGKRKNLN